MRDSHQATWPGCQGRDDQIDVVGDYLRTRRSSKRPLTPNVATPAPAPPEDLLGATRFVERRVGNTDDLNAAHAYESSLATHDEE